MKSALQPHSLVLETPHTVALLKPKAPRIRPVVREPKILRPLFQPLRFPRLLQKIIAKAGAAYSVESWVLAAAEGAWEHAMPENGLPPAQWIKNLTQTFPNTRAADRAACRLSLNAALPDAAWNAPDFLGEMLLASRWASEEQSRNDARDGRAGRVSAPSVYTPASMAQKMVDSVHVGPKRIVDPACGAGVFLLAAFERACHRRIENGERPMPAAKSALLHEITGIDVDAQALALCEFSLRLSAWRLTGLSENFALPLHLADALDPLPDLEGTAGAVVGNPPFVEGRGLSRERLDFLRENFRSSASGKVNLFAAFVERGMRFLHPGGVLSFILPSTFLRNERYRALRELLLENSLEAIDPVEHDLFDGRIVETVILRVRKEPPARNWRVHLQAGDVRQSSLAHGPDLRFYDAVPAKTLRKIEKMEKLGRELGAHFEVRDGISTGFQPFPKKLLGKFENGIFISENGEQTKFDREIHRPVIDGCEFTAYTPVNWEGRYIEYDKRHEHTPPHPGKPFNCQLRERQLYDRSEKLLSRQTARGMVVTLDRDRYFPRNSVHVLFAKENEKLSLSALCACLNSKLYEEYFLAVTGEHGKVFPQVHISDLKRLPVLPEKLVPGGELAKLGESLLKWHLDPVAHAEKITVARNRIEEVLHEIFDL